jgi:hypothetical protein
MLSLGFLQNFGRVLKEEDPVNLRHLSNDFSKINYDISKNLIGSLQETQLKVDGERISILSDNTVPFLVPMIHTAIENISYILFYTKNAAVNKTASILHGSHYTSKFLPAEIDVEHDGMKVSFSDPTVLFAVGERCTKALKNIRSNHNRCVYVAGMPIDDKTTEYQVMEVTGINKKLFFKSINIQGTNYAFIVGQKIIY